MQTTIARLFTAFLLAILFALPAQADTSAAAAERIKDRLAEVDALKLAGSVGENARGFLEARESLGPRQGSLIDAENADRRILYEEAARKSGQTVDVVGRQRALQIAVRARSGVWLQKPDGEWYRKP